MIYILASVTFPLTILFCIQLYTSLANLLNCCVLFDLFQLKLTIIYLNKVLTNSYTWVGFKILLLSFFQILCFSGKVCLKHSIDRYKKIKIRYQLLYYYVDDVILYYWQCRKFVENFAINNKHDVLFGVQNVIFIVCWLNLERSKVFRMKKLCLQCLLFVLNFWWSRVFVLFSVWSCIYTEWR